MLMVILLSLTRRNYYESYALLMDEDSLHTLQMLVVGLLAPSHSYTHSRPPQAKGLSLFVFRRTCLISIGLESIPFNVEYDNMELNAARQVPLPSAAATSSFVSCSLWKACLFVFISTISICAFDSSWVSPHRANRARLR